MTCVCRGRGTQKPDDRRHKNKSASQGGGAPTRVTLNGQTADEFIFTFQTEGGELSTFYGSR